VHNDTGVAVGLYQEFAELRLRRQSAMIALAVAVATTVALAVHTDAAWWAAISAFVSTQATASASLQRGALRIIGTALGAALAFLGSPWLVQDVVALSLVLLVARACSHMNACQSEDLIQSSVAAMAMPAA
jgi:uncharacterized membrane protein YccC